MSEVSDRIVLKENNLSPINSSFSSNKSFYEQLDEHTKRDILFLIKSGYNKKSVIKLYLIVKPAHVSEAIECLSKKDGLYQHMFYPSSNNANKCEICGNKQSVHKEEQEKTVIPFEKSEQDVSFITVKKNEELEEKLTSKKQYECRICEDYLAESDLSMCTKCKSHFCNYCLYEHAKELVKNGKIISCPYCQMEFNENRVKDIFSYNNTNQNEANNLKSLYKKNKLKFLVLSNPELVFCPIANCDGYAKKNRNSLKNKCNKGHEFCIRCGEFWHVNGNCPEDEVVDKLFRNYCEKLRLKECPSCSITTFKKDGCNHITCSYCRQNWCWLCEQVFDSVEMHYQDPRSQCFQRMLEGIIQLDMCQKCETPNNERNLINFRNCQHIICKNCIESFLLGEGKFKIKSRDKIKLKCPIHNCNNNQSFDDYEFYNIIRKINNRNITKKYKKHIFHYEMNNLKVFEYFGFREVDEFREGVDRVLKRCNTKRIVRHCYRCAIVANLYASFFIIFILLISFTTPLMFQVFVRRLYSDLADIICIGRRKILKIPIIITGEIFSWIFIIISFGIYYIYIIIYIIYSCCYS